MTPTPSPAPPGAPALAHPSASHPTVPWHTPVLERLGPWRALTLQQSVGIGPGNVGLLAPSPNADSERLA